jgi:hypothetical protein
MSAGCSKCRGGGTGQLTVSVRTEFGHDISNSDIDDAQETLVLLLKLFLVKDLNCQNAIFVGTAAGCESDKS